VKVIVEVFWDKSINKIKLLLKEDINHGKYRSKESIGRKHRRPRSP
jgi:hypothetical protein